MNLTRSLHNRLFASLWVGQVISRLGDNLYRIALSWWVLEKTGSAAAMGMVLVFTTAPMLVFMLIGGVVVDRFPRPLVMLLSDVSRAVIVGAVAVLAANGSLQLWQIFLASAIFGLVDAFFQPAYTAIVPEITAPEALQSANSLTTISGEITGIVGPALGAVIVGAGGFALAFGLDAVSFLLSGASLLLLFVHRVPRTAQNGPSHGMWAEVKGGIRAVLAEPWLWVTISVAALANMTQAGVIGSSLPILVRDSWRRDVTSLGAVYSAVSIGSVACALFLGNRAKLRHRGWVAYLAWVLGGLMILSYGLQDRLVVSLGAAAIFGACIACFGLIWTNTVQEMVPRELMGRVASIDILGSYTLLPVGYAAAGWATDRFGPQAVFIIGGALTAGLALSALLHPAIRKLD